MDSPFPARRRANEPRRRCDVRLFGRRGEGVDQTKGDGRTGRSSSDPRLKSARAVDAVQRRTLGNARRTPSSPAERCRTRMDANRAYGSVDFIVASRKGTRSAGLKGDGTFDPANANREILAWPRRRGSAARSIPSGDGRHERREEVRFTARSIATYVEKPCAASEARGSAGAGRFHFQPGRSRREILSKNPPAPRHRHGRTAISIFLKSRLVVGSCDCNAIAPAWGQ